MRVTPKISDMPTESRNRNMPTLSPLITCTAMSGPSVIHGKRLVVISASFVSRKTLFVLGGRRPELRDLIAAPDEVLAVNLLNVGDDRLALHAHLHHAGPLRRDSLLVTPAHDDRAPREFY